MGNIFSGLQITDMTSQATTFVAGLSPYVVFIVGILLAFLILDFIINLIKQPQQITFNKEKSSEEDLKD